MALRRPSLIRNPLGYIQVDITTRNLSEFYEEEYFQNEHGCYESTKTPLERKFRENTLKLADHLIKKRHGSSNLLDIGCGEGFFSAYFHKKSWQVTCSDFSSYGLERENPHLLRNFLKADAYSLLNELAHYGQLYDVVNLENVLEHVADPVKLLIQIKQVMKPSSTLRLRVPNDFSEFQSLLQNLGLTDQHWVNTTEHLSYFNKSTLEAILTHCGFDIEVMHTNFPIEIFLANLHSNYVKNPLAGRAAHEARMLVENHLIESDIEGYLNYMTAAAKIGFGRELTVYAVKASL